MSPSPPDPIRRRLFFVLLGGLVALVGGCRQLMLKWITRHDNSVFTPTTHSFEDTDLCLMTTEAIEGPYFIEGTPVRRDVREGKPGQDLRLGVRVVRADGCTPIAGALVSIWSCDALGNYAGYPDADPNDPPPVAPGAIRVPPSGEGRFLRGVQATDAQGHVEFLTIVPGWYTPRVQHIHVQVVADETTLLTAQLYFPQETLDEVDRQAPYDERGPSPFTNGNDFVIYESEGATGGWLRMSRDAETMIGTVTLGVPTAGA